MTIDDLKAEIAEAIDVEASEISDDTSTETVASWDSMASLRIISFLEENTEGDIDSDELDSLVSFPAILSFAKARGLLD